MVWGVAISVWKIGNMTEAGVRQRPWRAECLADLARPEPSARL